MWDFRFLETSYAVLWLNILAICHFDKGEITSFTQVMWFTSSVRKSSSILSRNDKKSLHIY